MSASIIVPVVVVAYIFLVVFTAKFLGKRLFGWESPVPMILIGLLLPFVWIILALYALISPMKESPKASSPKRSPARKSPVKKSPVKKSPVKKSPVKKSPVKKSPVKKSPARKKVAKK